MRATSRQVGLRPDDRNGFRHEVRLYDGGADAFVRWAVPFVREGIARDEAILVVARGERLQALRAALGADADPVSFGDMSSLGRNPARIIPVWADFLSEHANGNGARGIGEPIWAERNAHELEECQLHESLLNRAFPDVSGFWLVCPYDTEELTDGVLAAAKRSHPYVWDGIEHRHAEDFEADTELFRRPLVRPTAQVEILQFGFADLKPLRTTIAGHASAFGLPRRAREDLVLVVHELATNSIRHGGGGGTLAVWTEGDTLLCEVRDGGVIEDVLVGRRRPRVNADDGCGLWLVNQLSELSQLRSSVDGTVVRVHASRTG